LIPAGCTALHYVALLCCMCNESVFVLYHLGLPMRGTEARLVAGVRRPSERPERGGEEIDVRVGRRRCEARRGTQAKQDTGVTWKESEGRRSGGPAMPDTHTRSLIHSLLTLFPFVPSPYHPRNHHLTHTHSPHEVTRWCSSPGIGSRSHSLQCRARGAKAIQGEHSMTSDPSHRSASSQPAGRPMNRV
jgi:hypothetical protein